MQNHRNTPPPLIPHSLMERRVDGLRDSAPPPPTYRLFLRQPDGTEVFVGEFPTPKVDYRMIRKRNGGVSPLP